MRKKNIKKILLKVFLYHYCYLSLCNNSSKANFLNFLNLIIMTIKEFVLAQDKMTINGWLEIIKESGLQKHEDIIIQCAEDFDMIIVNHSAKFMNSIKY